MRREQINQMVAEELEHIPRIKRHLQQNLFRAHYNSMRRHDLGLDAATSASESLDKVLVQARKMNPGFSPIYDREFFST